MNAKKIVKDLKANFDVWSEEVRAESGREFALIREYFGITQEQLAEAVQKHHNTICNIENGKTQLKINEYYAYARAAELCGKHLGIKPKGSLTVDSYAALDNLRKAVRNKKQ